MLLTGLWEVGVLKYISHTVVQSFNQVNPILHLVLFENLNILSCFFIVTVPAFHYIDKKRLHCFSYLEHKSQNIIIL